MWEAFQLMTKEEITKRVTDVRAWVLAEADGRNASELTIKMAQVFTTLVVVEMLGEIAGQLIDLNEHLRARDGVTQ